MKRAKRLTPVSAPLRPASTTGTTGPSTLEIQAAAISELQDEIARRATVPELTFEAKLFAEFRDAQARYEKEIRKSVKWRLKYYDAEKRIALLEDRLTAMQMIHDQKEKA